jgi:hypothetical protein
MSVVVGGVLVDDETQVPFPGDQDAVGGLCRRSANSALSLIL